MGTKRILFSIEDFKTVLWGQELAKNNCEIVSNGERFYSRIVIILSGFFQKKRIHIFVFRYLNDNESLYESVLFFLRDFVTILSCKILGTKILWLIHNIDQETHQNYPKLSWVRRKMVGLASVRIFVTDPHLVEVAERYGFKKHKLDWTCFGTLQRGKPGQKNIEFREKIARFRESVSQLGNSKIIIGLCVSEPAQKKNHYLRADSIVGKCKLIRDCCVSLVIVGKYPDGIEFEMAKKRAQESPYIMLIEESFSVDEEFIADYFDFFYRGLTDQSIAFTLYVAAEVRKPMVVHDTGALPLIVERERLGCVIDDRESEIQDKILSQIQSWNPEYAQEFLEKRNWQVGAMKLLSGID